MYEPAETSGKAPCLMLRKRSCEVSHSQVRLSKIPVPDAIDMLVAAIPNSRSETKSLNDNQSSVRSKASGNSSRSQRSFAGQKLE